MILKLWVGFAAVIVAIAWYLTVIVPPPDYQGVTSTTLLEQYRASGVMPAPGDFVLSDEIGHESFDIPDEDAIHLAAAQRNAGETTKETSGSEMALGELSMGGTDMATDMMEPLTMTEPSATDSSQATIEPSVDVDDHQDVEHEHTAGEQQEHADEPTVDDDQAHEGNHADGDHDEAAGGHGRGGVEVGISILAEGYPNEVSALTHDIHIDRTATIAMHEWGYDPMSLNVGVGEVVKFVISHEGSTPHEFMLMGELGMEAVNYRLERADWNLLEHEAIFERSLVMPGEVFELVVKIHKPGMYMYMCMFPKHMQFGMMGMVMAGEMMTM